MVNHSKIVYLQTNHKLTEGIAYPKQFVRVTYGVEQIILKFICELGWKRFTQTVKPLKPSQTVEVIH